MKTPLLDPPGERQVVLDVDDHVLVQAAQAGDLDAFEVLLRRHQTPVYRVALRMLRSEADAQDASQEAFVQAWKSLGRFRGDSSFATWMYRIITNRSLNMIAAQRPAEPLPDELSAPGAGPSDTAERNAERAALIDAIEALPPEQRAPIVLREFQGLSYDDTARVLGVSLAAVKGRIHRARLDLVERLKAWQ